MRSHAWGNPIGRTWFAACVAAVVAAGSAGQARAQSFSLPKLDSVNFFFQAGSLVGSRDLVDDPSANEKTFGELGWGFETSFDMITSPAWDVELSVGYDQMFMRARFVDRYTLRGTLKNLPSISVYASHANGLYVGFGTGLVSLNNVSAFNDGHRAFSISGDTFDLTGRLGIAKNLGGSGGIKPANLFVELAYHARFLGSAAYGTGAPDTLPRSLYFGGVVISVGAQVSVKPSSSFDEEVKKEVKRLEGQVSPALNESLTTITQCLGEPERTDYLPIDDHWDPGRCTSPTTVMGNVRVLAKVPATGPDGGPPSLEVCSYATTPPHWKKVSERWDPTRCGRPQSPEMNVRRIQKGDP